MASSEKIGFIKCGLCGNENATVHKQTRGTKKGVLYYRCYTEIDGATMACGTIQCLGFRGQEFIKANMRADNEPLPVAKVEEVEEVVIDELPVDSPVVAAAKKAKKSSWWADDE